MRAPWSSNYTININTADELLAGRDDRPAPSCTSRCSRWSSELAVNGRKTAATNYGARRLGGASQHRRLAPVGAWSATGARAIRCGRSGRWPARGSRSTCTSISCSAAISRYLRDRAYPVMRGAAEFCLDWLIDDGKGHLVTAPSTSPEHKFLTRDGAQAATSMASTMDMALMRDLFANVHGCGRGARRSMRRSAKRVRGRARAPVSRTGSAAQGQLLELFEEFGDPEPQHRHFSHLFGLHPGRHITPRTPELFAGGAAIARAARRRRHRLEPGVEGQPLGAAARRRPRVR